MEMKNFAYFKSLFLENNTLKQTIFKNTFWLTVSTIADRLLRFALLVYTARILGPTDYGKFTFALSFVSLFVIFHDFGLPEIVVREFARAEEKKEEFYSVLSLKILLSAGTFCLILASSFFFTFEPAVQKTILILALFSLVNGFIAIFYSFFQAFQRMEYRAVAEVILTTLLTGIGFLIIFRFPSVENLSYGYLLSSFMALSVILFFFHRKFLKLKLLWRKSVWKKFTGMSWPLALAGLFGVIYNYIDSVMLGFWGMITQTGWYNAAYKIIIVSTVPGALISRSFYPVLSKLFKESKGQLQRTWEKQMELMIMLAIPVGFGGISLAPKIINTIYGDDFLPSILAFQILSLSAIIFFLNRPFDDAIMSSNQQKKIFFITVFGAITNIILNLILIPKYSLYGAAAATVITNVMVLLMYAGYTLKFTPIKPLRIRFLSTFAIAIISGLFMYFVITLPVVYNLNVFISIAVGAAVYSAFIFFFKSVLRNFTIYGFGK